MAERVFSLGRNEKSTVGGERRTFVRRPVLYLCASSETCVATVHRYCSFSWSLFSLGWAMIVFSCTVWDYPWFYEERENNIDRFKEAIIAFVTFNSIDLIGYRKLIFCRSTGLDQPDQRESDGARRHLTTTTTTASPPWGRSGHGYRRQTTNPFLVIIVYLFAVEGNGRIIVYSVALSPYFFSLSPPPIPLPLLKFLLGSCVNDALALHYNIRYPIAAFKISCTVRVDSLA